MGIDLAWAQELAWASGFFDGEGHCGNGRGDYVQIMVTQRHREPLERFQGAFGVGRIYETELRGKPLYHYCTHDLIDTRYVCDLLRPLVCSIKRDQIDAAWKKRKDSGTATFGSPEHYAKMSRAARNRKPRAPMPQELRDRISVSQKKVERISS